MSGRFEARTLDDSPTLLEASYRLRYQVYCREREFLPAEHYPDGVECDQFDPHSVHVGVVDSSGALAGTARVIQDSSAGLPLFNHCVLFPHVRQELFGEPVSASPTSPPDPAADQTARIHLVEVSRLSISRSYSRRRGEGGAADPPPLRLNARSPLPARRPQWGGRDDILVTLIKAIYQAAKRLGATHWIAATERSLQRRIVQYGLPFEQAGPEGDYLGRIAPYVMSLAAFDRVILGQHISALDDFLIGLEPQFHPVVTEAAEPLEKQPTEAPGKRGAAR